MDIISKKGETGEPGPSGDGGFPGENGKCLCSLTIPSKLTSLQVIQTSMYIRQLLQGSCTTEFRKGHSLDKNKNTGLGISLMVLFFHVRT